MRKKVRHTHSHFVTTTNNELSLCQQKFKKNIFINRPTVRCVCILLIVLRRRKTLRDGDYYRGPLFTWASLSSWLASC